MTNLNVVKRHLKDGAKVGLRRVFELGQRFGIDVLPRHFYSEIPDLRRVRHDDLWKRPFSMHGVAGAEIARQLRFVQRHMSPAIVDALKGRDVHAEASRANGEPGYGRVEAEFLYAFVRTRKPRTIFQVGCGVSTAICILASNDAGYRPEIICVDPYPTRYLRRLDREGAIVLLQQKVETLPLDRIRELQDDLLFFVDSTHTLGPGGEVSRIVLEMLPCLKPGSQVHFHDITFPYDYCRDLLGSALVFPHESILVHAFLAYNNKYVMRAAFSMLHYAVPDQLMALFPSYRPAGNDEGLGTTPGHFPSAAYLEVME